MKKGTKIGLLVGGATATITTVYFLNQKNRSKFEMNMSKEIDELAQPSDEQEDKMVYEGAQTAIDYVNRLQDKKRKPIIRSSE